MSDKIENKEEPRADFAQFRIDGFERLVNENITSEKIDDRDSDTEFSFLYGGERKAEEAAFVKIFSREDDVQNETEAPSQETAVAGEDDKSEPEPVVDTAEIEKKAYDEGFAKGEKEGTDAGKQKMEEAVSHLETIISQVDSVWKNLVDTYESQIVRLVTDIAEKVVYGHVAVDDETVKRAILQALELIPEPVEVTINVGDEDYEYIENTKREFFERINTLKSVTVVSDPSVQRGGCKIDTASGDVNSSIESRLEKIKNCIIETSRKKG